MKRNGCDIYGYPIYEPQESAYVIQSSDMSVSVTMIAVSERDAGQKFMDLLSLAMDEGIFIRRVQ